MNTIRYKLFYLRARVYVCMCAGVCVCVCACVRACVRACEEEC